MAIGKYYFNQITPEENAADVLAWLQENAADYFDEFSKTTPHTNDWRITCKVGDTAALEFNTSYNAPSSTYPNLIITLENGATDESANGADEYAYDTVKYAFKTSGGICLYINDSRMIFITKSSENTTAVYVKWIAWNYTNGDAVAFRAADLINSQAICTTCFEQKTEQNDITELAPLVFPRGTFAPNLYFTPYSQYVGQTGIIDVNGTRYVYDGYVAMKQ